MNEPHIHERMQHDLDAIRRRLRRMSTLVLRALEDAITAVQNRDRRLAYSVVLSDNRIDTLERHVDRLCQEFLIRHMPVAAQLRFIIAAVKVNSELERIGDYAEAIARRAVTLSQHKELPGGERIFEMARLAFQLLRQVSQAFLDGDDEAAMRAFSLDRQIDQMNSALFHELAHPASAESDLTLRFVLLGVLNRLERVADRACNIAEETIYAQRGEVLRHTPRHDVRVLFCCDDNSVRSQIAEGIGCKRGPAYMIFSSAGTQPKDVVDPAVVAVMAKHGIDISRQRPKGLADIGPLADLHVVVTMSAEAATAMPELPYHGIELNWEIADPSKVTGSPADIEAAYEAVYQELHTKINELIESMLGVHAEREDDR